MAKSGNLATFHMMKFTKTICATVLITLISTAWTSIARSENASPLGTFIGGGYKVIVGSGGEYVGYDPQGKKLVIPSSRMSSSGKTVEWRNNGYIYRLTGIGNSLAGPEAATANGNDADDSTDYRRVSLTIISPKGRVVLSQILKNPNYGRR